MSDVTVGAGSIPAAPAQPATVSPQGEAVINPNPVTTQTPIGSQAPPKPEGQESRESSNVSRRESIAKAFERSKQAQAEATQDKPKSKAPAAAEAKSQQFREQGRFARDPLKQPLSNQQPNQNNQQGQPNGQVGEQGQNGQPVQRQELPPEARFREPPPRFSEQAKAEWAAAPESVRGAVHQMARQFQGAYEKYRGDHEVMNELRPFHELATKQGTTLSKALNNYIGIEQKIRGDVFGGFDVITRNLGMKHPDGSPVTFRDVAYSYLSQTPEQHQLSMQQNQTQASQQQIGQLYEKINQLSQGYEQLQYERQFFSNLSKVDKFAETHPNFDRLAPLVKQELDLGFPLEVAYKRAELLSGSPQAAQTRAQTAQTRRTSISGAPDGSKPSNTRSSDERQRTNGEAKYPTRREAIAKAVRRANSGI